MEKLAFHIAYSNERWPPVLTTSLLYISLQKVGRMYVVNIGNGKVNPIPPICFGKQPILYSLNGEIYSVVLLLLVLLLLLFNHDFHGCSWNLCSVCHIDVDGDYTSWSSWTVCSQTCGKGAVRTRTRLCTNPPRRGRGRNCYRLGPDVEVQRCKGKGIKKRCKGEVQAIHFLFCLE